MSEVIDVIQIIVEIGAFLLIYDKIVPISDAVRRAVSDPELLNEEDAEIDRIEQKKKKRSLV